MASRYMLRRSLHSLASAESNYGLRQVGIMHTRRFERFLELEKKAVSPMHDVPLCKGEEDQAKGIFNMMVETPRWTNAKIEISREREFNPLVQDRKKDKLRYVANVFPHRGYIHNYGAIPQTWEDPDSIDPVTGESGDNDPLDVCEIGGAIGYTGQLKQVKVLGCMALLDEGETDWKILAIDVRDPMADLMHDIDDIRKHMPGMLEATSHWFQVYKIPDGKPANKVGDFLPKKDALSIIDACNAHWQNLIMDPRLAQHHKISIANGTLKSTPGYTQFEAPGNVWADHESNVKEDHWSFV